MHWGLEDDQETTKNTVYLFCVACRQSTVDRHSSQEDEDSLVQNGAVSATPGTISTGIEPPYRGGSYNLHSETDSTSPTLRENHVNGHGYNADHPRQLQRVSRVTSDSDDVSMTNDSDYTKSDTNVTCSSPAAGQPSEDPNRRPSVVLVDSTGHHKVLSDPSVSDSSVDTPSVDRPDQMSPTQSSGDGDSHQLSPNRAMSLTGATTSHAIPRTKHHAPQLMYSNSQDRVTMGEGTRPIYPSLPYSPCSSPCSSPRLRRQPTKETRRCSITGSGGWIQLNQYKLKDEIGKVGCQIRYCPKCGKNN